MKKYFLFLILMVGVVILATNCKSDDDVAGEGLLGTPILADYQFRTKITDDLTITFVEVTTDSRCPCEADCITAGQIGVKIKMETNGTELTKLFTLPNFDDLPEAVTETDFEGYRVELLDVRPYPCNGEPDAADDYYLEIMVTRS